MERELILPLKDTSDYQLKMQGEIEQIKKMLPDIESFKAFSINNEVFNLRTNTVITKTKRLYKVYREGAGKNVNIFIFCKN
jgi:hypothetical protein